MRGTAKTIAMLLLPLILSACGNSASPGPVVAPEALPQPPATGSTNPAPGDSSPLVRQLDTETEDIANEEYNGGANQEWQQYSHLSSAALRLSSRALIHRNGWHLPSGSNQS